MNGTLTGKRSIDQLTHAGSKGGVGVEMENHPTGFEQKNHDAYFAWIRQSFEQRHGPELLGGRTARIRFADAGLALATI
jgi:hypothetical protein